jgi:hypothetical protein
MQPKPQFCPAMRYVVSMHEQNIPRLTLSTGQGREVGIKLDHFDEALCDLLKGKLVQICAALPNASAKQLVAAITYKLLKELPSLEIVVDDDSTSNN